MAWLYLLLAGMFEVGWAIGLKYTEGFSRLLPSLPATLLRLGCIGLIVAGIVGLKFAA